jgi:hypothetical protein
VTGLSIGRERTPDRAVVDEVPHELRKPLVDRIVQMLLFDVRAIGRGGLLKVLEFLGR